MTLIVGILCSDGVVMASDRQVTHGGMGAKTVGHPGTKIQVLDDGGSPPCTLIGTSGAVGLGQQYADAIHNKRNLRSQRFSDAAAQFHPAIRALQKAAYESALAAVPVIGHQAATPDAVCGALLASPFADGLRLLEISPVGGLEYLTTSVPFVCIGSGKQNADPLLRFFWSIWWPDRLPTVQEAVLAAHFTITNVTELRTDGVGMGLDVYAIQRLTTGKKDAFELKKIAPERIAEHEAFRLAVLDAIREVRDKVSPTKEGPGSSAAEPDPPSEVPKPPTSK